MRKICPALRQPAFLARGHHRLQRRNTLLWQLKLNPDAIDPLLARKFKTFAWIGGATVVVAILALVIGLVGSRKSSTKSPTVNQSEVHVSATPPQTDPNAPSQTTTSQTTSAPLQPRAVPPTPGPVAQPEQRQSKPAVSKSIKKSVAPSDKETAAASPDIADSSSKTGVFKKEDIPDMLKKADSSYGIGDYGSAIEVYNRILHVDPQNPDAISGRMKALRARKDRAQH